jgi:8-oxoguanine deaminase
MRQWIRNPLACLAEGAGGGLVIENGSIVEVVETGREPAARVDTVFDAGRHVVLPGLINAHHHMYQSLTRAHPRAINKELFPWLETLLGYWARLTPEAHRLATRLTLVELLLSGCTTAADHHYLFAKGCEEAVDIQVDEARRLGMRMIVSRGSMDLSRRDGAMPPDSVVQDRDTILMDCERVIGHYHERGDGAMVQVALAPCTPFTVTQELMVQTAELARRHGCRLHTHLAETCDEVAYCERHFSCRPVDYLEEVGWMGPDVWLAHGIHFNDAEIRRLGRCEVGICHCPTSNMVLASGQCRTRELEKAGVALGLGVDGSASNDSSNLMESARHALLVNRLTYDASVTHLDVLRWASEGSARCLGRRDIGAIALGRQADLAFYTLDELRFSGAGDPIAALILCGAHRADRVMVAGRWLVEDGAPLGVDVERLRHEHGVMARRFLD